MSRSSYSIEKLHPFRQLVIDGMELASRKHSIHGLVEVDITQARERLENAGSRDLSPSECDCACGRRARYGAVSGDRRSVVAK